MMSSLLDVILTCYFDATLLPVDAAAMLRYFKRTNYPPITLPLTVPSLMGWDVEKVNEGVKHLMEEGSTQRRVN